jgi:hypothetical protein
MMRPFRIGPEQPGQPTGGGMAGGGGGGMAGGGGM